MRTTSCSCRTFLEEGSHGCGSLPVGGAVRNAAPDFHLREPV
jgi:hypothetical protein